MADEQLEVMADILDVRGLSKGRGYIANQVIQHKLIFSVCVNQNAC